MSDILFIILYYYIEKWFQLIWALKFNIQQINIQLKNKKKTLISLQKMTKNVSEDKKPTV